MNLAGESKGGEAQQSGSGDNKGEGAWWGRGMGEGVMSGHE